MDNQYQDLAHIVNVKQDEIHQYRAAISNFCTLVRAAVIRGSATLSEFYEPYVKMGPCIHKYAADNAKIDLNAFSYALQRLPFEIVQANHLSIKSTPEDLSNLQDIKRLHCSQRKRAMYQIGKDYVQIVARDSESDILDILSAMIMYGKEASKIRKTLVNSHLANDIKRYAEHQGTTNTDVLIAQLADKFSTNYEHLHGIDLSLDNKLLDILQGVMQHEPEHLHLGFDREFSLTDAIRKAKDWAKRIEFEIREYQDRPIILISSNTHSVVNCLTGFAQQQRELIAHHLNDHPEMPRLNESNPNSLYYAIQKLTKTHPDLMLQKQEYETKLGIKFLKDQHETGIDVQVIDTKMLDYVQVDPRIKVNHNNHGPDAIILNIDYAFGVEGKHIMTELCDAFTKRIQSISITGKAGIVCGDRYDVMLPTVIIPQIEGGIYQFPHNRNNLRREALEHIMNRNAIHDGGPMLTVPGTAIQNEFVLYDYMVRYGILGLEMEAGPYFDAIEKARQRQILRDDIQLNVGYWGSDNPLKPTETLASNHMELGFDPSYNLIIGILNTALNQ
jgi:hypothetical protein